MAVLVGNLQTYPSTPGWCISKPKLFFYMKQRIMEVLLTSNNNLSKEEILWVASHLPETTEKGDHGSSVGHTYTYDHEKKSLYEAIGVDASDGDKTAELLSRITRKCALEKHYSISNAIEDTLNECADIKGFFPLILSKVYRDALEKLEHKFMEDEMPKELLKFIKAMRKRDEESGDE